MSSLVALQRRFGALRRRWQILIIAVITLACAEVYIRCMVFCPNRDSNPELPVGKYYSLTVTHGHQPRPGYIEPEEGASIGPWNWLNGQRSSRPLPLVKRPLYKVALLGCSWTYGIGALDQETYAWQLNNKYPNILFDNYAVSDYGAHLNRLRMRDTVAQGQRYDLYIYAFIYDHLFRDMRAKQYRMEGSDTVYVFPGYELGQPNKQYCLHKSVWIGERQLSLMRFLHKLWCNFYVWLSERDRQHPFTELVEQRQAFRENVLAMRDLARSSNGTFAVLALGPDSRMVYEATLADSGIPMENALEDIPPGMICRNNGNKDHPNAMGHRLIAKAVTALLKRQNLPAEVMVTRSAPLAASSVQRSQKKTESSI